MENSEMLITRPNAGDGIWLMFLLPISLIMSSINYPHIITSTYKLSSIFSFGLICSSVIIIYRKKKYLEKPNTTLWSIAIGAIAGILFRICLHRGLIFSLYSGLVCTIYYEQFFWYIFKKMPKCFTVGEGAICIQGFVMLLYFTSVNFYESTKRNPTSNMKISTVIIQYGIIGILTILLLLYKFDITSPRQFWISLLIGIICVILVPMRNLLQRDPLVWIFNLFVEDLQTNKITIIWVFCTIVAIIAVHRQIQKAKKASTAVRKIFHILAVTVFVPGLLCNCTMLYLASGVILGVFVTLEIIRILNISPLSQYLLNGLVVFSDEKDRGVIALTPLYLLAGCSLPLWIHPAPCDVTNSGLFNLLPLMSGVLTIGIGDTAASFVGSKFGRFHWKNSKKTIEGTIAFILFQGFFIAAFLYFDLLKLVTTKDYVKILLAVVITGVIEAKTNQVDNLVLPFVMYVILIV